MHLTLRDGRDVDFIEEKKIPTAFSQSSFCVILAARSKLDRCFMQNFKTLIMTLKILQIIYGHVYWTDCSLTRTKCRQQKMVYIKCDRLQSKMWNSWTEKCRFIMTLMDWITAYLNSNWFSISILCLSLRGDSAWGEKKYFINWISNFSLSCLPKHRERTICHLWLIF